MLLLIILYYVWTSLYTSTDFSYKVKISCALVATHYCSYSKNRQDLEPFSRGKIWKTVHSSFFQFLKYLLSFSLFSLKFLLLEI